jgi:hypothetical protein
MPAKIFISYRRDDVAETPAASVMGMAAKFGAPMCSWTSMTSSLRRSTCATC